MPASTRSSPSPDALWVVVLAGGVGSRFWPVSTPSRPKQVLPLAGELPLVRQTVERVLPLVPAERIRILTGAHLAGPILEATPQLDQTSLLLEPRARGTAPVLAWAAHTLAQHDPAAVMISLHADHVIAPEPAFRELLAGAAAASVRHQRLFTIGARPTRPETGYGYIMPGEALDADDAGGPRAIARFVEKPDAATAQRYIESGFLWNTGLFIWPAALLLAQLREHTPELAPLLPLLDAGDAEAFFAQAPNLTIDVGLLERTDRAGVVAATFDWDDVGAWDAVARTRAGDGDGNVLHGEAYAVDARDNIVWAEDGAVALYGVHDLVVVRANGITLVAPRERAADLKHLLERLPEHLVKVEGAR